MTSTASRDLAMSTPRHRGEPHDAAYMSHTLIAHMPVPVPKSSTRLGRASLGSQLEDDSTCLRATRKNLCKMSSLLSSSCTRRRQMSPAQRQGG